MIKIKGFEIRQVLLGKTKVNYASAGTGASLVFVHGLTNDWLPWVPLARILRKSYKLYLMDLPGYGDSGKLTKYSIEIQAKYVHMFIGKLRIKPKGIVGISMGSMIVAKLAELYPKLTASYILVSAVFKTKWQRGIFGLYNKALKRIRDYDGAAAIFKKALTSKIWIYTASFLVNMERFDKKLIDEFNVSGKVKMTKEAFIDMSMSVNTTDLEDILKNCKGNTLIIQGSKDKICNYYQAKKALLGIKNVKVVDIKNGSHLFYLERPSELAEVIKRQANSTF